jgi:hypothetical protein
MAKKGLAVPFGLDLFNMASHFAGIDAQTLTISLISH